jgi:hypothetical protein
VDETMEQVRPEHVTPEDYRLPAEYQELMGERPARVEETPDFEEPPQPPISETTEITVPPAGEPAREPEGYDWPFEEVPPPGEKPSEGAPPATDTGWGGSLTETDEVSTAGWDEPATTPPPVTEDVDISGGDDFGVAIDEGGTKPPPTPPRSDPETNHGASQDDELHSFFFEDDIVRKEKDEKRDSFWE